MKQTFGLILFILISVVAVRTQELNIPPPPPLPIENESYETGCGLRTNLVAVKVWVTSSKKGFLTELNYKNFEIYDEKSKREIEFFTFDEQTNQYIIGFSSDDYMLENKWHEEKVEVKLSVKEKKEFGKTVVSGQTGYYSDQN